MRQKEKINFIIDNKKLKAELSKGFSFNEIKGQSMGGIQTSSNLKPKKCKMK